MTISIYNTLTNRQESLQPIEPGHVRMYVCGVTVYDYCHIGHGRTFVAFDVVQRWLKQRGYRVTFVRNITDIDDKIIRRAAEKNVDYKTLTAEYTRYMQDDLAALGCERPTHEPRATDYIPQMLNIIGLLQKNDLAYQASDGDVDYAVRSFKGYGKLSGKSLDELRAGERVAVDRAKRDPLDFVLWKRTKPGEPQWESPWGTGRPGWHIECSAMASELLGKQFDIHGGGPDLIFPHHENEIAQSEGAFGCTFANTWMHSAALRVGEDKMSKSLNNFWTIRDALKHYEGKGGGELLRFFLLRSHYRSQINFLPELIDESRSALNRLYIALRDTPAVAGEVDWNEPHARRFAEAMDDDFNTAEAVSELFKLAATINQTKMPELARQLKGLGSALGILQYPPEQFLKGVLSTGSYIVTGGNVKLTVKNAAGEVIGVDADTYVLEKIQARAAAKKTRNFAEADRIRAELLAQGIVLEDKPDGTTDWRRK